MRTLVVEDATKLVEAALLTAEALGRWRRYLGLERAVHSLVATVLLRLTGLDALGPNAEAHPPHREVREPAY